MWPCQTAQPTSDTLSLQQPTHWGRIQSTLAALHTTAAVFQHDLLFTLYLLSWPKSSCLFWVRHEGPELSKDDHIYKINSSPHVLLVHSQHVPDKFTIRKNFFVCIQLEVWCIWNYWKCIYTTDIVYSPS